MADSMEVRGDLIARFQAGEFGPPGPESLASMQNELKAIKRAAKKNGQKTRSQVFNQS